MAERAQKVVVRDGSVFLYSDRWGGQRCAEALTDGEPGLQQDLEASDAAQTMWDPDFAEGGYLVDFDRRCILIHSWDKSFISQVLPSVSQAWPGWSVRIVADGVPDFLSYLSSAGLGPKEPAA